MLTVRARKAAVRTMVAPVMTLLMASLPGSFGAAPASAQGTDIYVFDLESGGDLVVQVTDRAGYDNQPAFGLDSRSLLFTSDRAGGQMDIFRYDMETGAVTNLTETPDWNEFSGKPWNEEQFSFVLQEGSPYQNVWRKDWDGGEMERVLTSYIPAGYYAVNDAGVLFWARYASALFFEEVGAEVGPANGESIFVTGQVGTSIHPIPGTRRFSFVHHETDGSSVVKSLDPVTGGMLPLVGIQARNEEHCWTPDGVLLTALGRGVYQVRPGDEAGWQLLFEADAPGVETLTRCAVSPDGRYVAFVNTTAW